jgi:hypothetical protein
MRKFNARLTPLIEGEMKLFPFALILFALGMGIAGCEFRPDNQFIKISGPVHIASNTRVVIRSPDLMRTQYSRNLICLQPSITNRIPNERHDFGALSRDGKVFAPQVSLLDTNGVEDPFITDAIEGAGRFCYSPKWLRWQQTTPHAPYTSVIIMSPADLDLDQITWFSGDK